MDDSVDKSVSVSPKVTRKFYEPIALLVGLNSIFKENARKRNAEIPNDSNLESEEIYHGLLSKLSLICDQRPKGDTITSFVILQAPDKVEYVFASNKRSLVELETTKAYISSILRSLGDAQLVNDEQQDDLHIRLVEDILLFNLSRIRNYLSNLVRELGKCIEICEREADNTSSRLQDKLQELLESTTAASDSNLDDQEFLDQMRSTISLILRLRKSTVNIMLQKRASDNSANNTQPWREVRHIIGRLLSYDQAVDILIISRYIWPNLFHEFEVKYIPSSKPHPNPLLLSPLTSEIIIGRMLAASEKDKYVRYADALPHKQQLDEVTEKKWVSLKFRPYVHVEVLLLNWLENSGGTRPPRFFNNWRYIGCSKPTCRLCEYYFASHPSGVGVRGGHGNFYSNWRCPDLSDVDGEVGDKAISRRQGIMQAIMVHLKDEIIRILKDSIPATRPHDSSTQSTAMYGQGLQEIVQKTRATNMRTPPADAVYNSDWIGVESEANDDNDSGCHV